jgi:hypothetical protein
VASEELRNLARHHAALAQAGGQPATTLPLSRHLALGLLWWNPALPDDKTVLPLHWVAGGPMPLAVMRSAWNDPRALFVAIKGGTPDHSHGHMDVGSFVFEADGVRWAVDLGTESYVKMRAARLDLWNYGQDSSRWTTFRVGAEGHNILRFDGQRQRVDGRSTIRDTTVPGTPGIALDLSPSYRSQVASARRRVSLLPGRQVQWLDEWQAGDQPVAVAWQWLTRAAVTLRGQQLVLRQAGQSLTLAVVSGAPLSIEVQDLSVAPAPQDSDNPGLARIVVRLKTPAGAAGHLKVTARARHQRR